MAGPYPMGDFHLLFFASFPGALRIGSFATVWGCPIDFRFRPKSRHPYQASACLKGAGLEYPPGSDVPWPVSDHRAFRFQGRKRRCRFL